MSSQNSPENEESRQAAQRALGRPEEAKPEGQTGNRRRLGIREVAAITSMATALVPAALSLRPNGEGTRNNTPTAPLNLEPTLYGTEVPGSAYQAPGSPSAPAGQVIEFASGGSGPTPGYVPGRAETVASAQGTSNPAPTEATGQTSSGDPGRP
jgi:hypothetical protein